MQKRGRNLGPPTADECLLIAYQINFYYDAVGMHSSTKNGLMGNTKNNLEAKLGLTEVKKTTSLHN